MENFNAIYIETNGTRLYVVDEGKGIPVVLLHGFPDSHKLWRNQIPALVAAGYRVIAPDLRGYGESELSNDKDISDYHQTNLAKDVIGILDSLQLSKVHLVGHDFGAVLGWTIALTYPERVFQYTALSVGHPYAYKHFGGIAQKIKGLYTKVFKMKSIPEVTFKMGNYLLLRKMSGNHPEIDSHWIPDMSRPGRLTAALNWYRGKFHQDDINGTLAVHAQIPVLAIWGRKDNFLSRQQMVQSSRLTEEDFQYVEVENAGHWIPIDAPDKVTELLLQRIAKYNQ